MSLDEYDGSDMELDSDSSERYYNYIETAIYNQCSKSSNSSNMNENKDKLLDNDKKIFSTSLSPQSENGSLQSSNNRSDHINEFSTKPSVNSTIPSKISCVQTQPPSPPFNFQGSKLPPCPLPENTMNNLSKTSSSPPLSNTSSQVTLSTSSKQTNGFFLKSSMNKSPTSNNVNNEPTKLEKHDKIKFELKSTGYKNRLLSQADKQSLNTSAKNIFKLSNNVDMMNAYDTNLVKESTFMNKSSSLPAKVSNSFYIKSEKVNKRVIDDKFKEGVKNHVTEEKQSHKQVVIENPLGKSEVDTIVVKKDLNKRLINNSKIIKKYSAIVKKNLVQQNQLFNNNSTNENSGKTSEKQQEQFNDKIDDDNNLTLLVKDSVVLKKGQDQEKNQFDNNDPKIQEIVQKEQAEKPKDIFQNTEVQLKNVDVVEEPVDLIQNLTRDDAVNKINNEVQVMDIDNDYNKSTEYPSLSTINTEEDKSDNMELDQVNMSEQDHKNKDENITSKMDIIEKSEEATSSEKMEIEKKKNDELETQVSPKIKDKGKKVAIPADKVIKTKNQADASSSKPIENEMTSQVPETSHTDLLTNLMTQFTNQINETSRQSNQYNAAETQSNEIQRPFNHIIQPTDQSTSNVTQSPQPVKKIDKVEMVEEILNFSDLSKEIVEKYHKLDNLLLEFDEITKKAVNAYDELQRLLPEGTVIRIDPPTTYKWDMIANMLGIADMNRQDDNENKGKNNSDEEKADLENGENAQIETSSEIEFDDEDMDIPSDDPGDKNFKCRSTILKQPNPKRWHNTRSNRPPSANLRQRTKVDPDSSNISTTPTTSNSPSKKKQSQTSSKRTLRTRKGEDEGDDITTTSNPQKHLNLDKYYEDGRPRRPANGFSFFCGDMCAKVRNEKLPISGTIAYAAEIWKKMSNEEKRPWLERGEKSKSEYQDLLIRWKEEQEELKNSGVKRTVSPKATSVFSYKKPRNDEHK